jgi:hypothetical protein
MTQGINSLAGKWGGARFQFPYFPLPSLVKLNF